jgi:hypothetical protein
MSERLFTPSTAANFTAFQTEQAVPALVDVRNCDGKAAVRVKRHLTLRIGSKKVHLLAVILQRDGNERPPPTRSLGVVWLNAGAINPVANPTKASSTGVFKVFGFREENRSRKGVACFSFV